MKYWKLLYLIVLVCLVIQNCSSTEGPEVCTSEFVMHTATVINPDGKPVDSVNIDISNQETGRVYECGEYLCSELDSGTYVILHDGFKEKIKSQDVSFLVKGRKDSLSFNQEYVFRKGKCHIEKVSGPDTVSLASS